MEHAVYVLTRVLNYVPGNGMDRLTVGDSCTIVAVGSSLSELETFIYESYDSEHTVIESGPQFLHEVPLLCGNLFGVVYNVLPEGSKADPLAFGIEGHTPVALQATEFIVMYDELPPIIK